MAIQIRRGNDAEWESNKSNIVAGEPAVTLDSERMFVGTGSGTYMELANLDVLADAFDSSATYAVGDYCTYQGKLYKFTAVHSGAWSSGDVEETTVGGEVTQESGDVLTEDIKQALLQIAEKAVYVDEHGQDYYDALYDALYPYVPPAELTSITATYTQSGTVYLSDDLDSLIADLVVVANYSDSSSETLTSADYSLSGMLEVGTSVVTVTYEDKTTTFNVTVSAKTLPTGYTIADYITNENTSGYSYISTGYTPTGTGVKVKARFKNTASTGEQQYAVTSTQKDTTAAIGFSLGVMSSDTKLGAYNGNNANVLLSEIGKEFGDVLEAKATYASSLVTLEAYGQSVSTSGTSRNFSQNPVILFGLKNRTSTTVSYGHKGRIYYVQVWQGDTLVSDMVPCIQQSDSKAGFYDLVGGAFHSKSDYTFEAGYNS